MIILILGANSSGKSAWAEQLAARLRQGRLVYIATMIPYGEEGRRRVERHREQRRDAGFITVETPLALSRAELLPDDTVLLEDASNLTANLLFSGEGRAPAAAVLEEIAALSGRCGNLLIVSISGLAADAAYDEATNHYIEVLRQVNQGLFSLADTVYELQQGQARLSKGRTL